jgi:Rieske Fe-S protein
MRIIPFAALFAVSVLACNTSPKEIAPEQRGATEPAPVKASSQLGQAIPEGAQKLALSEVSKNPKAYVGKEFVTTGTVSAVCQHMGCWMTLKDDGGDAFIRMAGHAFFIPKDASGKKARVHAKLVAADEPEPACAGGGDHKMGCKAEAEKQTGKPLAQLQLEATGVELY